MPGSVILAALLAWPVSGQDSTSLYERIRFCLLSMLGGAFLVWGLRQPVIGWHGNLGSLIGFGLVVALLSAIFLIRLWFDKFVGMLSDLLLGCFDVSDHSRWDMNSETRQIEKAVRLYRRGRRRRALRQCNRIIESNSQFASTATTLAYWIENPVGIRFVNTPRTKLAFRGRFSSLNRLLTF